MAEHSKSESDRGHGDKSRGYARNDDRPSASGSRAPYRDRDSSSRSSSSDSSRYSESRSSRDDRTSSAGGQRRAGGERAYRPSGSFQGGQRSDRDRDRSARQSDPSYGSQRDDRSSYGSRRDEKPRYGSQRDDKPRYDSRRDDRPSYGGRRDESPRSDSRRDDKPRYDSRRDDKPRYGSQRDDKPRYDSRRDDKPRYDSRRDDKPRYGSQRDDKPRYDSRRDDKPRYDSRRDDKPRYDARRDDKPRYGSQRDDKPRYDSRRDDKPRYDARRDDKPRYDARRDDKPAYGSQRDDKPRYDSRREDKPRYDSRRDEKPRYDSRRDDKSRYDSRRDEKPRYDSKADERRRRDDRSSRPGSDRRRDGDQGAGAAGSRPPREDHDPRTGGAPREERRNSRPGQEARADRPFEPRIPDGITGRELDKPIREELRGLSKETAERVGQHIVAAYLLEDTDLETSQAHARFAARIGGRVGAVREAYGILAYRAGDFRTAARELRTSLRITGRNDVLPMIADSERGLGKPERALDIAASDEASSLGVAASIELMIVVAGAYADTGDIQTALRTLEIPALRHKVDGHWQVRLWAAYADLLERAERPEEAKRWLTLAADADSEGLTDAAERLGRPAPAPAEEPAWEDDESVSVLDAYDPSADDADDA
ncbi:MAG: hypothetical protein ACTH8V_01110, partial [Brachybacterium tyrofermentans]